MRASWVVRWGVEDECRFCGGGWCKCECVGGQKGLSGSFLIRVTSMHYIKSIRMFEDGIASPKHAFVIQGGSLEGLGRWSDICNLKNICLFRAVAAF